MTSSERLDWLKTRQAGIGGSDVAAILGLSKYKTALDVYTAKTAEAVDDAGSQAAYWGSTLEDVVAKEFAKRTGMKVQRVNTQLSRDGWMIANLDRAVINPALSGTVRVLPEDKQAATGRLLTTDTILECKTASSYVAEQWGPSQENEIIAGTVMSDHKIPIYYETQVQWYLGVTGATTAYVAVLLGGQDFRIYCVERDEDVIDALQQKCKEFWVDHVVARIPPAPSTKEDVAKLFAKDDGEMAEASNLVAADIGELRNLTEKIKTLQDAQDAVKDRICAALGEKAGFTIAGEKACTFKTMKSTRIDSTRLKKEQPALYADYSKTVETRVFRLIA